MNNHITLMEVVHKPQYYYCRIGEIEGPILTVWSTSTVYCQLLNQQIMLPYWNHVIARNTTAKNNPQIFVCQLFSCQFGLQVLILLLPCLGGLVPLTTLVSCRMMSSKLLIWAHETWQTPFITFDKHTKVFVNTQTSWWKQEAIVQKRNFFLAREDWKYSAFHPSPPSSHWAIFKCELEKPC